MSLSWGPWGPVNLLLDALIVALELGCGWWLVRRRGLRGFSDESVAVAFAAAIAAAAWLPLVIAVGSIIGFAIAARVAWTTCTVTVPLYGLFAARRHRVAWPAVLAVALLCAKFYGERWEPRNLEVARAEIRLPGLKKAVRVVHLSDVQCDGFGDFQRRIAAEANGFDADLVLFTGDLINHRSLAAQASGFLASLRAKDGKFFVTGDVDGGYDLEATLRAGGFTLLDQDAKQLDGLGLLGVSVPRAFDRTLIARLAGTLKGPRILLSHRPDAVFVAKPGQVDLVLSGHTHGGQVCLPFLGPIITLTRVPRKIAAGGVHLFGEMPIVVSRGLGWEGHLAPRVRAFCRPQLLLLTLVPA